MPRGNLPVVPVIPVPSAPHGCSEQTDPEIIRCFYVEMLFFLYFKEYQDRCLNYLDQ